MATIIWMVIIVAMIAVELLTLGLTTIWFVGGGIVAFIIALLGGPVWLQVAAFLVVSILLLVFTRPIVAKYFNKDRKKTNIDSLIGKQARVTEQIDNFNQTGSANLDGQEWTARAFRDSDVIPEGSRVEVVEIKGVKLIVTPVAK